MKDLPVGNISRYISRFYGYKEEEELDIPLEQINNIISNMKKPDQGTILICTPAEMVDPANSSEKLHDELNNLIQTDFTQANPILDFVIYTQTCFAIKTVFELFIPSRPEPGEDVVYAYNLIPSRDPSLAKGIHVLSKNTEIGEFNMLVEMTSVSNISALMVKTKQILDKINCCCV